MNKYELNADDEKNIKESLTNDILHRKKDLINLSKILNCLDDNYVISIDGKWGTGKTFFVNQLLYCFNNDVSSLFDKQDIEIISKLKTKYIPIYYNAWSNDDQEDVVESLIYNILNDYPKYRNDILFDEGDFRQILECLLKSFIEKSSLGIMSTDLLSNFKSLKEFADNVTTYEEKKKCLENLLKRLVNGNERILLIIDELDRCKPSYAVKMIETLKHFYNNKKITIIISTDNSQLSKCIKHFYGVNFDGYGYLNKIYDTVITLTIKDRPNYLESHCTFFNDIVSSKISYSIIDYYDMSLRECNRFVSMYDLSYKYINLANGFSKGKNVLCSSFFLIIGIALKLKDIDEYNRYIKGANDNIVLELMRKVIDDNEYFYDWFVERLTDDKSTSNDYNIENELINAYHTIFKNSNDHIGFPMIEALTMIGNRIVIEE